MMKKLLLLLMLWVFCLTTGQTQPTFFIDSTISPEQMVVDFFSTSCVTPSNITYTGAGKAKAYVQAAGTGMQVNAGILLCSGDVKDVPGPNDLPSTTTAFGQPGDFDLSLLSGFATYDASVLEFDMVSSTDTLCFYYIFASEEYPEFVNTSFNDVFAFTVTGPGSQIPENIAVVPGDSLPVTVNTINPLLNTQYYMDNDTGQLVEYDGYTTILPAKFVVIPDSTYHVKLAIADASDQIYDSGVIIAIESLCGDSLLVPPTEFVATLDDYTLSIENHSRYATDYLWDFGDGTTSTERYPDPHTYAQEGIYEVSLTTENYCCSNFYSTTVTVDNVVSVEDIQTAELITLSPNPFQDYLDIQMPEARTVQLDLMDLQGRVLQSTIIGGSTRWKVRDLSPGVFLIRARSGDTVQTVQVIRR